MALSLIFLLAWSALAPKPQQLENKAVAVLNSPDKTAVEVFSPPVESEAISAFNLINFSQKNLDISFVEPLATIKEADFISYQNYKFPLQSGFLLADQSLLFNKLDSGSNEISFIHNGPNMRIIKKFIFSNSNYDIWLEIDIQNTSNAPLSVNLPLSLGRLDFSSKNINARYQGVTIGTKDKILHIQPKKNQDFGDIKFLGFRDQYFCAVVEPETGLNSGYIKKVGPQIFEVGVNLRKSAIEPGQITKEKFHIYLGPQDLQLINSINPNWAAIINFGTFDFISQILLQLLRFFYALVHNWGWAIVMLSCAVYLILFPLTLKQMRSMKEMQALQPKIEELKKLYKGNPQRQQKEQMELFRKHKVNPLSGCLPLVLQMPIFFALYQTLMRSVFLRGASFLWIKDLSRPDGLFSLPFPRPFDSFNLLPILMMLGMFVQQKLSTGATASTTAGEQQKIMLIMMPLIFGFIFYSMPSGLVLYWFINSALTLMNQFYQLRGSRTK